MSFIFFLIIQLIVNVRYIYNNHQNFYVVEISRDKNFWSPKLHYGKKLPHVIEK
jgi:hypothetical protein